MTLNTMTIFDSPQLGKPGLFAVFIAWLKLSVFRQVKVLIGIGYVAIIAEGLRMVVPALGMKIHKLPFLGVLKKYQGWHGLDLALCAGMLLFLLSNWIWCELLEAWLYDRMTLKATDRSDSKYEKCLTVVGSVILFSDACLFYRAMTFVGWGSNAVSFPALLCTLAYVAVLVAVCTVSVNLKRSYLALKRGRWPQGVES